MSTIYAAAKHVLVRLAPADSDFDFAMEFISTFCHAASSNEIAKPPSMKDKKLVSDLGALLR